MHVAVLLMNLIIILSCTAQLGRQIHAFSLGIYNK